MHSLKHGSAVQKLGDTGYNTFFYLFKVFNVLYIKRLCKNIDLIFRKTHFIMIPY